MIEEYDRTIKALRRNRGKGPREIKTFKSNHVY